MNSDNAQIATQHPDAGIHPAGIPPHPEAPSLCALMLDAFFLAILVGLFYWPFLSGRLISGGADMLNLFLPAKAFTREAFSQGVIPLWNPHTFGGAPFLATMQMSVLYPFNLIAIAFNDGVLGINLFRFAHLWWMALGMCVFLRIAVKAPRPVAIGCALALPCGQFIVGHLDHVNHVAGIAWFPWWMTAMWFCLRRPSWRVAAALALTGAMQWLVGYPQQIIFTLMLSAGYLLAGTLWGRNRHAPERHWKRVWLCAAGGTALSIGLGMAQILPTLELGRLSLRVFDDWSVRQTWPPRADMPPRYAARYAMHPKLLALFGNPYAWREAAAQDPALEGWAESRCYPGWLILLGAGAGLIWTIRRRHREGVFWAGAIALAVVFAMGDATLVHWLISTLLPPLRSFRAPPRVLFIAIFALSVLSARGWIWLIQSSALLKRSWAASFSADPTRPTGLTGPTRPTAPTSPTQPSTRNPQSVIRNPQSAILWAAAILVAIDLYLP
ncbi:MAG: hypothetical protein NTX50_22860 [Candidatus Sumerlaeota bacterium]|nr:hypothetical protein [Candidatus Sumerlaeota bacterium]